MASKTAPVYDYSEFTDDAALVVGDKPHDATGWPGR